MNYPAVVTLDTSVFMLHRGRTAEIPSLTKEQAQEITKTVGEVLHWEGGDNLTSTVTFKTGRILKSKFPTTRYRTSPICVLKDTPQILENIMKFV